MTKKLQDRINRLMPNGIPRWIRCYDNGGESWDRYTVCFTGRAGAAHSPGCATEYQFRGMSTCPCDPQGFGQWGSTKNQPCDTMGEKKGKWYWPPAMGRKCHLGKRIPFSELPEDCRKLVLSDYKDIWNLREVKS